MNGDTGNGGWGGNNGNAGGSILATLTNGVRAISDLATKLGTIFPVISGTSTTAVGGGITPPAQVTGYITVTLQNGTSVKVPYYS